MMMYLCAGAAVTPPTCERLFELYREMLSSGSLSRISMVVAHAHYDITSGRHRWPFRLMDELSSIVADPSFAGGQHNIKGLILDIFERAREGDERDKVMGILLRFVAVADLVKESGPLFKCVSVAGVFKHGNSFALLTDLLFRVFESKTLDAATRRTYLQIIGAALIAVAP
jgi:hypothetical protein